MLNFKILNHFTKQSVYYFTLVDQVIVSLCNFLVSIIIIRLLGVEIFGQFSFLWLFLLLINSTQLSYIISPMLTNAPKQSRSNINFYYGGVFCQQLIFTSIIFFIVYFVLKFFGSYISSYQIEKYFISFPFAIVAMQLHQFFRRLLFSKKLYFRAVLCDGITYTFLIFLLIYLNHLNKLNLEIIFWSFVLAFSMGAIINFPVLFSLKYSLNNTYTSIKENWIIAKWMLATALLQWLSGNLWIVNTGIILGPFMLGIVRACQTLINITNLIFQSIENIIPGETSQKFSSGGINEMHIYLKKFALKGFIIVAVIVLIIIIFAEPLLNIFYGTETANYYYLLMFLSLILPFTFFAFIPMYGLRTLGKTKPIFISFLLSSFVAIVASKFIITNFKLSGLIFGLFIHQIIITGVIYMSYLYYLKTMKKKLV